MGGVVFRDADGREGYISEGLEVDYPGKWDEEVEACVARIEDEHSSGSGASPNRAVYNHLLIDLPEVAPIVEVERVDGPTAASNGCDGSGGVGEGGVDRTDESAVRSNS